MRVIGVTGGIGSGKSTVSSILGQLGARVLDADRISKQVTARDGAAYRELVDSFGTQILGDELELDRRKLASIVFDDRIKLEKLNNITHKHILDTMGREVEKYRRQQGIPAVVLDVPIPVKHGFLDVCDEIWVVTAPLETRIARIMERSGMNREEAMGRIQSQLSEEEYLRLGHHIIQNEGDLYSLRTRVEQQFYKSTG